MTGARDLRWYSATAIAAGSLVVGTMLGVFVAQMVYRITGVPL